MLPNVYQLGFTEETSIKGKFKSVRILDTMESFLDNPACSNKSPLDVLPPLGPARPTIAPYYVVLSLGFSKSLTRKLIALAVEECMRNGYMSSAELSSVQSFIQPLFYVKAIWKGSGGVAEDMYHSISGKMMEAQRPRPDVLQIAHAFAMRANIAGAWYKSSIEGWL